MGPDVVPSPGPSRHRVGQRPESGEVVQQLVDFVLVAAEDHPGHQRAADLLGPAALPFEQAVESAVQLLELGRREKMPFHSSAYSAAVGPF